MSTAIFYASNTGNSEEIAHKISKQLGEIEVFDISNTSIEKINEYDNVILGGSTWGDGELNDDWDESWDDFIALDLSNKTIALFGLGDQETYSDDFCSAIGIIYEYISTTEAKVIGFTSTDGYDYEESKAEINGEFIALIIDEDNQDELTDERIKNWVENIRNELI